MKLLKFSASWCQPCKALTATISATTLPYSVEEIDVDENWELPSKYMVRGVPTLVAVDDAGGEVARLTGSVSGPTLRSWCDGLAA